MLKSTGRFFFGIGIVLALCATLKAASEAPPPQFRAQFGVKIPMRDGVHLVADVWLPQEPGRYPAILVRTPYLKNLSLLGTTKLAQFYAGQGYVYVVQDTRGRGDSEGEFNFFFPEGKDGYDTIEWMASQPWSNGRVGMMGLSYLGTVQWLAAREHPPHLVCITPTAPAGHWFDEIPYTGGAWARVGYRLAELRPGPDRTKSECRGHEHGCGVQTSAPADDG